MTASAKRPFTTSLFYMWRALLAMAHADGEVGQEELDYFRKVFDNLPEHYDMSQEQRDTLADEIEKAQSFDEMLRHINDTETRATLYTFAEQLAMADGVLHPSEEAILERLRLENPYVEERQKLLAEIRVNVEQKRAQHRAEMARLHDEMHTRSPWLAAIDGALESMGIDILE